MQQQVLLANRHRTWDSMLFSTPRCTAPIGKLFAPRKHCPSSEVTAFQFVFASFDAVNARFARGFWCLWKCCWSCISSKRSAYTRECLIHPGFCACAGGWRPRATLNVSQTFGRGESQKDLHYSYDVTHPATAKIIKLAELGEDLAAVSCSPHGLSLVFTSSEAADSFHAELLDISNAATSTEADRVVVTGGPEWKCAKRQADHQPVSPPHHSSYVLRVDVAPLTLRDTTDTFALSKAFFGLCTCMSLCSASCLLMELSFEKHPHRLLQNL